MIFFLYQNCPGKCFDVNNEVNYFQGIYGWNNYINKAVNQYLTFSTPENLHYLLFKMNCFIPLKRISFIYISWLI